jgi:hypothetical protein
MLGGAIVSLNSSGQHGSNRGVDVACGLTLLFGLGTMALTRYTTTLPGNTHGPWMSAEGAWRFSADSRNIETKR